MNNLQLLLSIGIPSLLVILTWMNGNARLTAIEKRLDQRLDALEKRMDGLEKRLDKVDARLDAHDRRFDDLKDAAHKDALVILHALTSLHERVAIVESRQNA